MDWKKILAAAGGAAGACAVLYYVMKTDAADVPDKEAVAAPVAKPTVEEIKKEQVRDILSEILTSQELMKTHMKELTKVLLTESLTFDQTYQRVNDLQPSDPLERHGLSMTDFDQLLEKHQNDPQIREAVAKIMGAPDLNAAMSEKLEAITVQKIVEIHAFMLEELNTLVENFSKLENRDKYNPKTVTIVAQAIVGAKTETKFGVTSEDIENAVMLQHAPLAMHHEFSDISNKIQQTVSKLMDAR